MRKILTPATGVFLLLVGCSGIDGLSASEQAVETDKPLPNFPLHYRGNGVFFDASNPTNTLVARYTFNMELGINHEIVHYIDRDIIAMHVYDLDPSDGTNPDREYFIEVDGEGTPTGCSLSPFPLPNVFNRAWWLHNNMTFTGQETINGYLADCWDGIIPEFGAPARLCSRADSYPELALLLKRVAVFDFYDYFGTALGPHDVPASLFKLPQVCKDL